MSLGGYIVLIVCCVLAEGFFSGSEMALVNADKWKLRARAAGNNPLAKLALKWVSRPSRFFSVTLLGTNLATVTLSVATTFFIFDRFGEGYLSWAMAVVPVTLIFGELVPKSIYQHYADFLVEKVVVVLQGVALGLAPIVWILSKLTSWVLGEGTLQGRMETPISRDELEMIVSEQKGAGDIQEGEITMVTRIFDLARQDVADIQIPLNKMTAIAKKATVNEALQLMEREGHSRLPVYEGIVHQIVGVLHTLDLLFADPAGEVAPLIRPAYVISGEVALNDLLLTMKREWQPMAIVLGSKGEATGLVTLEDLIEQVVGDIRDEHD